MIALNQKSLFNCSSSSPGITWLHPTWILGYQKIFAVKKTKTWNYWIFPLEGGEPSINMINKKELIQMSEFFRDRESEFIPLRHYLLGLGLWGKRESQKSAHSRLLVFFLFFSLFFFFFKAKLFPSKEILQHQTRNWKLILKNSTQAPQAIKIINSFIKMLCYCRSGLHAEKWSENHWWSLTSSFKVFLKNNEGSFKHTVKHSK